MDSESGDLGDGEVRRAIMGSESSVVLGVDLCQGYKTIPRRAELRREGAWRGAGGGAGGRWAAKRAESAHVGVRMFHVERGKVGTDQDG